MSQSQLDLESMVRSTILDEMVRASQAANMPKSFIENIKLIKVSETEFEIENAWQIDGKPLAVFFEYGTKDHYVEPKTPDGVLAWPGGGPNSGQPKAIYSKQAAAVKGKTIFDKGHYVTGLPAYEPMTRGFKIGSQRMREKLSRLMLSNG